MPQRTIVKAALAGGLVAGALDIIYVITVYGLKGVPAQAILQSVATGLYGRDSYNGGWSTALQGLGLHFFMALLMATAFCLIAFRYREILSRPVVAGVFYGLILFCVMNFLVVPLSNAAGKLPQGWYLVGALFAHTVLVGQPIAFFARHFLADAPVPGPQARVSPAGPSTD